MKRRLRVCNSCSSHVPVTTPLNAPCPFCGFVAEAQGEQPLGNLRDTVLSKGKSGVMIAALGLTMACGEADPKPDNNDTNNTTTNTSNSTPNIENPNITADYAGGPINIETGPNIDPNVDPNIGTGSDAGTEDAGGETDMG